MPGNGAYRRIVVPVCEGPGSDCAVRVACRLAADRGAAITAVSVVEVPPLLPLDAHMLEEEDDARRALARAQAVADGYGIAIVGRIVRARDAGPAIVAQVRSSCADAVVVGAERRLNGSRRTPVFGPTAGAILKGAPCRVVLVSRNGHHPG